MRIIYKKSVDCQPIFVYLSFLFNAVLRIGYSTIPHASEEKSFRCEQDKAKKKNPTGAYIDVRDQGVFFSTQYCGKVIPPYHTQAKKKVLDASKTRRKRKTRRERT